MNTFFAFLLAGTLNAAAPVATPVSEPATTTSYVATETMAVWVTSDQKMHLILERNNAVADVRLADDQAEYLHQRIDRHQGAVRQKYDLSALPAGTYQLTIRTEGQIIRKTIVVSMPDVQRIVALN